MPSPVPPADRKHGNGDRNDNDVAKLDHKLQTRRDKKKAEGRKEAERQSHWDRSTEQP